MKFFRNPQDLSSWVKELGAKQAASVLVNLPKVGKYLTDIVETSKRIAEANDNNAAEVLFGILKSVGITENEVREIVAEEICGVCSAILEAYGLGDDD